LVTAKTNRVPRGVVPGECEHVTAFVDVHDEVLYWAASAWTPHFAGGPIDYGTHPRQPTAYFSQSAPPAPLSQAYPTAEKEGRLLAGLTALVDRLVAIEWRREDGARLRIGQLLIDARYHRDLVVAFCRRSAHAALLMPAMGFFVPRGQEWSGYFSAKPRGTTGFHWRIPPPRNGDRYLLVDTNWWKTLAWERLRVALGDPGCWSLFGQEPGEHSLFADHCCAERAVWVEAKGLGRYEWEWKEGRPDNHWWDCLIGSAVAASRIGCAIPGTGVPVPRPEERMTLAELAGRG
jgi:hypothetical protein